MEETTIKQALEDFKKKQEELEEEWKMNHMKNQS
jgi:hypothetical protein